MHADSETTQRVLALADMYWRLTGKSPDNMSGSELMKLYRISADRAPLVDLLKIVEREITANQVLRKMHECGGDHGYFMLPPSQRVI
jgi:hypothetical protein